MEKKCTLLDEGETKKKENEKKKKRQKKKKKEERTERISSFKKVEINEQSNNL